MTLQEERFLVNYLGNRKKGWGIHDAVKERFAPFNRSVAQLVSDGYIVDEPEQYRLTIPGKLISDEFKKSEKAREKAATNKIMLLSMERDYLGAYNERAKYELECIIPHGITTSPGGSGNLPQWKVEARMPSTVMSYVKCSKLLDFSDCNNSEVFKSELRAFYVGTEIAGSGKIFLPNNFEELHGEFLDCPALEKQLKEKCLFKKIPKLRIYFNTKVSVLNSTSSGLVKSWDGNFILGSYDCTDLYHFDMAEFELYSEFGIPTFPKTFNTFFKHKRANSEKYQAWMKEVGNRKLIPIISSKSS